MLVLPSFIGDQITMTDDIKCVTLLYPIKINHAKYKPLS